MFTDQKPHIATDKDVKALWSGASNGRKFYCKLCGHKFQIGDTYRWVSAGSIHRINLLVCSKCDGPDVLDHWEKWWQDWEYLAKTKFRYIADQIEDLQEELRG